MASSRHRGRQISNRVHTSQAVYDVISRCAILWYYVYCNKTLTVRPRQKSNAVGLKTNATRGNSITVYVWYCLYWHMAVFPETISDLNTSKYEISNITNLPTPLDISLDWYMHDPSYSVLLISISL